MEYLNVSGCCETQRIYVGGSTDCVPYIGTLVHLQQNSNSLTFCTGKYNSLSAVSTARSIAMKLATATAILGFSALASAHGFVQQIWLGENLVDAWNPYKDPQKSGVNKITRKFKDNGPVTDGLFTVSHGCNFVVVAYD